VPESFAQPTVELVREGHIELFMSENESDSPASSAEPASGQAANAEEITYHAVEKDGLVTAIWEMQGRKHLRTIDPRSRQGREILNLYTTEHHDENPPTATEAASS
jgi:hypothetical protein